MHDVSWPIRILIYLHDMRSSGYIRVTERDLVRQWENLNSSIRAHLTFLESRGLVELSTVSQANCFVRLTDAGIAFIQEGARLASSSQESTKDE
jgi:DNA-binding MarR family transcriptional regulator